MRKRIKRTAMVLYFVTLFITILLLLMIGINEKSETYQTRNDLDSVKVEKYQCQEETDADAPVGIRKIYTLTLPENIQGDISLAFYFVHQYVRVYLEDELVYSVYPASESRIVKTLGCDWVMIPLFSKDAGKQVRVEITPVYKATVNREVTFFVGSKLGIFLEQANHDKWQIGLSLISVIIGIVYLGIGIYYMICRKQNKRLLVLGEFSLMLGLWRLMDTRFSPLIFQGKPIFLFYISVAMIMIGTVPFLKMLQSYCYEKEYVLVDCFCGFNSVLSFALVMVQMLGIADIRENLIIIHMTIIAGVLVAIGLGVYDWIVNRKGTRVEILGICAIGVAMDVAAYYVKGNSSGLVFTLLALQMYILYIGIKTIRDYVLWEKRISEQETELLENRIAIMLSQIKPHFIFNSLTTIKHLCRISPEEGMEAIDELSDFLRGSMDAMGKKKCITFTEELNLVNSYLYLEKKRFGDKLNIEYDIQAKDFIVPALSVQPIVENAVRHGIRGKLEGGTITISTKEDSEYYYICIVDDGAGYDPSVRIEDGRSHVGIENVTNRIKIICNGDVNIESKIGEGTKATIIIPKEMAVNSNKKFLSIF